MANLASYIMIQIGVWLDTLSEGCLRFAAWLEDVDYDEFIGGL